MVDKFVYRVVPFILFVLIMLVLLPQTSGTMLQYVSDYFLRR